MLERLAGLESDPTAKRAVLGEAAKLAERLGDGDRALRAWGARLAIDNADAEALDATVELLARAGRWEPLIETLEARAEVSADERRRRDDLVRAARTWADALERVDEAITAWVRVRDAFGEDAEVVDALADLYTRAARWDDLLELLDRAAGAEAQPARRATLLRRAGDVHRNRGDAGRALAAYREALDADPAEAGARAGLTAPSRTPRRTTPPWPCSRAPTRPPTTGPTRSASSTTGSRPPTTPTAAPTC
ncbi:MAG: hypothetical protein R3A52_07935 [Polyangiales bacterium]